MRKPQKTESALIVKGIGKYIEDKNARANRRIEVINGETKYLYKGKEYSKEEFYEAFPMVLHPVNFKGENRNKKIGWLTGKKSY